MGFFGHHRFVDRERVRAAILAAERITTAPMRVSLAPYFLGDAYRTARQAFKRLRLDRTPERNAVLFFIVPARRTFVVFGDAGAHEKVGQEAWDRTARTMEEGLRAGDPTAGVIRGIEEMGRHLAKHFPRKKEASS